MGNFFADNEQWATFAIATIAHTGVFALLALILAASLHRTSRRTQAVVFIVASVAYALLTFGVLVLIGPINL